MIGNEYSIDQLLLLLLGETLLERATTVNTKVNDGLSANILLASINGFVPSIIAIGLIRSWLSLLNGLGNLFETSIIPHEIFLRGIMYTIFLGLFGLPWFDSIVKEHRRFLLLCTGILCPLFYGVGCWLPLGESALIGASVVLCAGFVIFLRVWGEDNLSADYKVIIIRLALSFFVQYAVYTSILVVPQVVQKMLAVMVPIVIAALLFKPPYSEIVSETKNGLLTSSSKTILLLLVIVLSCFGHGAFFTLSVNLSSTWTLGPLILGIATLVIVRLTKRKLLLRLIVCLTLLSQCVFAIPTLISGFSVDWASLLKSFSYTGTMMLALSFGCWIGSLRRASGRSVCQCIFVYFASFYTAEAIFGLLDIDPVLAIMVAFSVLLLASLIMLSTEWVSAYAPDENGAIAISSKHKEAVLAKIAKQQNLTLKEEEVLGYLANGATNNDVAQILVVSVNTVRTHIQAIYQKLSVHNRSELEDYIDEQIQKML